MPDAPAPLRPPSRARRLLRALAPVTTLALTVVVVRGSLVTSHRVRSQSMLPGLVAGDVVVTQRFAYAWRVPFSRTVLAARRPPARGELVVFRAPGRGDEIFVKRVIGVAGDRIRIEGRRILVNGRELERRPAGAYEGVEPEGATRRADVFEETAEGGLARYAILLDAKDTARWAVGCAYCGREVTVGRESLFVVGDNRDDSTDSRHFGMVPESSVIGRPWLVAFSADERQARWSRVGTRPR